MQKQDFSGDILKALDALKNDGGLAKWGSVKPPERVNVFQGELKKFGVKNTGAIATPTIRNERAFLVTVVGVTSVLATAAGQLPGDWVSRFACLQGLTNGLQKSTARSRTEIVPILQPGRP